MTPRTQCVAKTSTIVPISNNDAPVAYGSGRFARFRGTFTASTLLGPDFANGVFVELELNGSIVWIDNVDVRFLCNSDCGDLNGDYIEGQQEDLLTFISVYGLSNPDQACLDPLRNGYINSDDISLWDLLDELNSCSGGTPAAAVTKETSMLKESFAKTSLVSEDIHPLLISGLPVNGNAIDESGNGNDGIVNGAIPANDRFGAQESAYYFDGVDDYIESTSSPFNFGYGAFTFSAWIKVESIDFLDYRWGTIIEKRNYSPGHTSPVLLFMPDSTIAFGAAGWYSKPV